MPLRLHAQCRTRIVDALAAAIVELRVDQNAVLPGWLTAFTLHDIDMILPRDLAQVGLVGEFSDRPLMSFVTEYIQDELRSREWSRDAPSVPLTAVASYADPAAAAERIVAAFESLPWRYMMFVKTPLARDFAELLGERTELAPHLLLFVPDAAHAGTYPLPSSDPYGIFMRRSIPNSWSAGHFYMGAHIDGYIGRSSSREGVSAFVRRIKSFAGLLLALDLYRVEPSPFPTSNATPIFIYTAGPSVQVPDMGWLSDEDAATLQSFQAFETEGLEPAEIKTRRDAIVLIRAAFAAQEPRLLNAARWFFDSYSGENELLSFVQAMIAVEILFGEKATSDIIGIGQLIANRCAYLIGKTVTERERIIADIGRIYDTRSAIVHRGKETLSTAERTDLFKLKRLCRQAIRQELVIAYRGMRVEAGV